MPELASILIGLGQFYGLLFKCCQVQGDFMTRIGIFFYLYGQYFRLMSKCEPQLVDILLGIDKFFILIYSIYQYNGKFIWNLSIFLPELADILVGNGQFYSLKFKCQVSIEFLTRIGIFFYLKWSVFQINIQIWIPIDRDFARNWRIFLSDFINFPI